MIDARLLNIYNNNNNNSVGIFLYRSTVKTPDSFMTRKPTDTHLSDFSCSKKTGLLSSPAFSNRLTGPCHLLYSNNQNLSSEASRVWKAGFTTFTPLFTACRTFCCKIFPIKLSAVLATRLAFTVWRHEAGVSAPALPAHRRPNNCPVPEQRRYPANFRAWLQTSVKHCFILRPKPCWRTSPSGKLARLATGGGGSVGNTANAVMLHGETAVR